MKRQRRVPDSVSMLTYVWLKWINNHNKSNDTKLSYKKRRESGERCERLQVLRQRLIIELNDQFNSIT